MMVNQPAAESGATQAHLGLARGTVAVVDYDPAWPAAAAAYIDRIQVALAHRAVGVEHVGSTAVPGLAAKPIIDLAVELAATADLATVVDDLVAAGFIFRGDKGDHGGLLFVEGCSPVVRAAHIHVLRHGDQQWRRYLTVRSLLRARPALAARYEAIKRDLAARYADDRGAYTAAKAPFFADLLSAPPTS